MQRKDELVFELKGRRPTQIPMDRMAAYMREFSALIGQTETVLFSEVREGSTCIAARMSRGGTLGGARQRAILASRGEGPSAARTAYHRLREMASDDGLPARVKDQSSTIIHLPRNRPDYVRLRVQERGHITGELSGIVKDSTRGVKARVRPMDGGPLVYCAANEETGKKMGALFLRYVRVYGKGWWTRSEAGAWVCESFDVDDIHEVKNVSIKAAVDELKKLDIAWVDDPFDDLDHAGTA